MGIDKEHEENINREFEESEGTVNPDVGDNEETRSEQKTSLGKASNYARPTSGDVDEIQRIKEKAGYIELDLSLLPSRGRFYRNDMNISIRAADVGEITNYSTMDEENAKDMDDKINDILISCTRVFFGNTKGSYKDILEEDRLFIILSIKELSFKESPNRIMLTPNRVDCNKKNCPAKEKTELRTDNLQFHPEDDLVAKYYEEEDKCYNIKTRRFGNIKMSPPTIGVMRVITEYIRKLEKDNKPWDKAFMQILPYIQRDWRGFTEKSIFQAMTEFQGWDRDKYSLLYRLAEKIKVGIEPQIERQCSQCGLEVTTDVTFPGGLKNLFVISDISGELL